MEQEREVLSYGNDDMLSGPWYDPLLSVARESHGKVNREVVVSTILQGCDIHAADWDRNTALYYCAEGDNVSAVEILIDHGASIDVVNGEHVTPIYAAIRARAKESALCLLGRGCKVNTKCTYGEFTALHLAAKIGMHDLVDALLKRGAKVDMLSRDKTTPLMLACEHGYSDTVRMLVASGANLERRDRYGRMPFHCACMSGVKACAIAVHHRNVTLMSAYSSSMSPYSRWNAAMFAASSGSLDMLEYVWPLLPQDLRTPIDVVNPLCVAAENGHQAAVDWILAKERYTCTSLDDMGALLAAVQGRQASLVRALANRGVRLDLCDHGGCTAAHYAVVFECPEILEFLLERGASVDAVDKDGWTPLLCSVRRRHIECTKILLRYGANPYRHCRDMSAYDLARTSPEYQEILGIIQDYN